IRPSGGHFGDVDGIPLTASLVDQQAALYGHGRHAPGQAKFTFGTGGFALVSTGTAIVDAQDAGLLPTAAWQIGAAPVHYALDGGIYSAGAAVDWAQRIGMLRSVDELNRFDAEPAIARRLVFVPALTGLACPHWDRSAGASWIGMTPATTREDLLQALLEGVALRAGEVVDAIDEHVAIDGALSIDGGLTNSPYFCQFLCDILQRKVRVPSFNELTALGAARLAARGAGLDEGGAGELSHVDYGVQRSADVVRAWRSIFAQAVARSRAHHV
ncbi:MAG TPA: FGGY-family carbohydrate kinase, partial [Burkholderiaceae bacterium]